MSREERRQKPYPKISKIPDLPIYENAEKARKNTAGSVVASARILSLCAVFCVFQKPKASRISKTAAKAQRGQIRCLNLYLTSGIPP